MDPVTIVGAFAVVFLLSNSDLRSQRANPDQTRVVVEIEALGGSVVPLEGGGLDTPFVGVNLDKQPSWAKVAQAMGAEGHTIDKVSDVGPALAAAARAQNEGKTTILEMMVTRELGDPFRRDALSLPVRHLPKYQATAARR